MLGIRRRIGGNGSIVDVVWIVRVVVVVVGVDDVVVAAYARWRCGLALRELVLLLLMMLWQMGGRRERLGKRRARIGTGGVLLLLLMVLHRVVGFTGWSVSRGGKVG